MALNLNESIIPRKIDVSLDPSYTGALERGMVMVFAATAGADGQRLVRPSAGAGGEKVAGILMLSETSQDSVPTIETASVPASAPLTITLRETPISIANIRVFNANNALALEVVAGVPAAGQVQLVGDVLTFNVADAGDAITVFYRFTISAAELARRGGRRSINNGAERLYNQVTLAQGEVKVLISNFDTGIAFGTSPTVAGGYAIGASLLTGANGRATVAAGGVAFGVVHQLPVLKLTPGIEQAFIGLSAQLPIT